MADFIHTPSLATWGAYAKGLVVPGALGVLLLRTVEADATLRTRATVADVLAAAGTAEANWTGGTAYARKTGIAPTNVTGTAVFDVDMPDQTWAGAGAAPSPQALAKFVVYWRPTTSPTDANSVVLGSADYTDTANGSDLTATINAAGLMHASG